VELTSYTQADQSNVHHVTYQYANPRKNVPDTTDGPSPESFEVANHSHASHAEADHPHQRTAGKNTHPQQESRQENAAVPNANFKSRRQMTFSFAANAQATGTSTSIAPR
jgi:hypothetical protein